MKSDTDHNEASPKVRKTEGNGMTAIDLCNEYLFTFAVSVVLGECFVCFWKDAAFLQGLPSHPKLTDIPLLFGLLVLFCGNFNFYKRLIEPRGETPGAALYSLLGMLAMAFLPILMLLDSLLWYRYIILGCYAILVMIKNELLKRRFQNEALGHQFRLWTVRAVYHFVATMTAGTLFYVLLRKFSAEQLWITLAFNVLFAVVISVRFVKDQGHVGAPPSA